tara:strand:- start:620 stop:1297 length:678 start_codon:yes stop_codon:yes gene_type:complete
MSTSNLSLLRLMNLMSPTLPIGGFTYSQGIEKAIESNWINDYSSAKEWLESQLLVNLKFTDLPILTRLYKSIETKNYKSVLYWSNILLACRETMELREEEKNRGRSLAKLIDSLEEGKSKEWSEVVKTNHLFGYALLSNIWDIPLKKLLLGYSWSWLENQVSATVKIIPLGQTDGQKLLNQIIKLIPSTIKEVETITDDKIGISQPAFIIASCLHETQYTRIYRS